MSSIDNYLKNKSGANQRPFIFSIWFKEFFAYYSNRVTYAYNTVSAH